MSILEDLVYLAGPWAQTYADWISNLTLGQIWRSINYHPLPRAWNWAIFIAVLITRIPRILAWWSTRQTSRRICSFYWPVPPEASPDWKGQVIESPDLFSHQKDDSLLPPSSDTQSSNVRGHITCYDPATGYHLTTKPLLAKEEVAAQIQAAHDTQPAWGNTTFAQRKSFLRSLKAWILRDMDGIVRVACRDTGKTRVDAVFGEILTTLSKIDWLLKHGEKALSPQKRPTPFLLAHKVSKVHYQPLGPTLALVSWNYSSHNMLSPMLASLFAGNVSIVKCSEQVAWSSMWFFGAVRQCLQACNLPVEAVQLVICLPDVAETITRNPLIRHITFIGSEPVGRKVAAAAADIMVPACIELGGKDPAFILPDTNIKAVASIFLRGVLQSAGQNCIGYELFMIPQNLYQEFLDTVTPRIKALRPGIDVGSLISSTPIPKLTQTIKQAESSGARVLTGGNRYNHPDYPHGSYFEPTLICDVTMDMDIAKTELFAPVMTVVPYDSVDQAISWLNRSRFGLGASVFGNDQRECRRVAEALECGMVAINDFGVFYLNQAVPFGGVKASGYGRFGGEEGLRALCNTKSIIEDRFFSWVRTSIPKAVDVPYSNELKAWAFLQGIVDLGYHPNLIANFKGLVRLLKNLSG